MKCIFRYVFETPWEWVPDLEGMDLSDGTGRTGHRYLIKALWKCKRELNPGLLAEETYEDLWKIIWICLELPPWAFTADMEITSSHWVSAVDFGPPEFRPSIRHGFLIK